MNNILTSLFILTQFMFTSSSTKDISIKSYQIKTYPSLYYEIQIAELNQKTEIELFFDQDVEEYINLFLTERKDIFLDYLEKSDEYFPIFERFLKEFSIPDEIKYLPVIESGLCPIAVSPSKAVGLWQFKENTAKSFGLEINAQLDERKDPELSTIAACKYLNYLQKQFNNWSLSLLAYNSGPGCVRKAQNNAGDKNNYYQIYPHLTDPAKRYLPALVAIIYLFHNTENHFIFE